MAHPQTAPCVNINDEFVQVVSINVEAGRVRQAAATSSARSKPTSRWSTWSAEQDGYVLKIVCAQDQKVPVGSVMLWLGDAADEPVPEVARRRLPNRPAPGNEPTAKARAMLKELDLDAARIPATRRAADGRRHRGVVRAGRATG